MTDTETSGEYHCPECKSRDVEAFEYGDGQLHIYCNEPDCRWVNRGLHVGIFQPGGSEYKHTPEGGDSD